MHICLAPNLQHGLRTAVMHSCVCVKRQSSQCKLPAIRVAHTVSAALNQLEDSESDSSSGEESDTSDQDEDEVGVAGNRIDCLPPTSSVREPVPVPVYGLTDYYHIYI